MNREVWLHLGAAGAHLERRTGRAGPRPSWSAAMAKVPQRPRSADPAFDRAIAKVTRELDRRAARIRAREEEP
jgi:hypothetical protein